MVEGFLWCRYACGDLDGSGKCGGNGEEEEEDADDGFHGCFGAGIGCDEFDLRMVYGCMGVWV